MIHISVWFWMIMVACAERVCIFICENRHAFTCENMYTFAYMKIDPHMSACFDYTSLHMLHLLIAQVCISYMFLLHMSNL